MKLKEILVYVFIVAVAIIILGSVIYLNKVSGFGAWYGLNGWCDNLCQVGR